MVSNSERMAVNAAIEKLIARNDEDGEAARVVIEYGSKLKKSSRHQFEYTSRRKNSGDEVSGYSPGHGEVTIKDEAREERTEKTLGFSKDRVGQFRLWKNQEGVLVFHHFWKSDASTQSMDDGNPEEYYLGYDPESLESKYLAVRRKRAPFILDLGIYKLTFSRFYLEPIYGQIPRKKE